MALPPEIVKLNLEELKTQIANIAIHAGRDPKSITLIGASKSVDVVSIQSALEAGLTHFGENYLQEAKAKQEKLNAPITWHFIGHLQRRKVKEVIRRFTWIHSLDRPELAEEIHRRAKETNIQVKVLIEVNLGNETSKSGCQEANLKKLVEICLSLSALSLQGLMTIPPYSPQPQNSRSYFRHLRELRDQLERDFRIKLPELSMGMSQDFPIAIEEGATMLRIGTRIFGPRKE